MGLLKIFELETVPPVHIENLRPTCGSVLDTYINETGMGIAPGYYDEKLIDLITTTFTTQETAKNHLIQSFLGNIKAPTFITKKTPELEIFLRLCSLKEYTALNYSIMKNEISWEDMPSCPLSDKYMNSHHLKNLGTLITSENIHVYPVRYMSDLRSLPIVFFSKQAPGISYKQIKEVNVHQRV